MKLFEVIDDPFAEIDVPPEREIGRYDRVGRSLSHVAQERNSKGDKAGSIVAQKRALRYDPKRILAQAKLVAAKKARATGANTGGVMGIRLPEYERILKVYPSYAFEYARDVLKDRFPEAEPYIIQAPQIAYQYFQLVMTKIGQDPVRWPEAEAGFATVPKIA